MIGSLRVPLVALSRQRVRFRYRKVLRRIRRYPHTRKIRVLFLVMDAAKWKAQSLYETMRADGRFHPVMALTTYKDDLAFDAGRAIRKIDIDGEFYRKLGNECVEVFDRETLRGLPLSLFSPDIVFFQGPGSFLDGQYVFTVSKYALCCYIPYSIETVEMMAVHKLPYFHEQLFLQIAPTEADARYIRESYPQWRRAGSVEGLGHTVFDEYVRCRDDGEGGDSNRVIYAPHFSFPVGGKDRAVTLSTFLTTGKPILDYARKHPEMNWLFKPHPLLRRELEETRVWTKAEIDAYYSEWDRIGGSWDLGDYIRLFLRSKALITDCSSFLVEYAMTGKPIIRLMDDTIRARMRSAYEPLFSTYYSVRTLSEMMSAFSSVLERGEDPKREARRKTLAELGLTDGQTSAAKIMGYLKDQCWLGR